MPARAACADEERPVRRVGRRGADCYAATHFFEKKKREPAGAAFAQGTQKPEKGELFFRRDGFREGMAADPRVPPGRRGLRPAGRARRVGRISPLIQVGPSGCGASVRTRRKRPVAGLGTSAVGGGALVERRRACGPERGFPLFRRGKGARKIKAPGLPGAESRARLQGGKTPFAVRPPCSGEHRTFSAMRA